MNTYITRIWLNNCNSFIISDCPDKHAAAVAEMIANGGRERGSDVCVHGLGEIVVNRSEVEIQKKSLNDVDVLSLVDLSGWKHKILLISDSLKNDNIETRENISDQLLEIAKDMTDVEYGIFFKEKLLDRNDLGVVQPTFAFLAGWKVGQFRGYALADIIHNPVIQRKGSLVNHGGLTMSKKIARSIAIRTLEVEADIFDAIHLTSAKSEYMDLFLTIINTVDVDTKSMIEKMDGLTDPILGIAIRKAYFMGLQDGMGVGVSL